MPVLRETLEDMLVVTVDNPPVNALSQDERAGLVASVEACEEPMTAAVVGNALGGGLKIALGCHYRIAVPSARFGLPEVTLCIVPGAGGTQRLSRLVDPLLAAKMLSDAKPIGGGEALTAGLADELVEDDLMAAARRMILSVGKVTRDGRRLSLRVPETGEGLAARGRSRKRCDLWETIQMGAPLVAARLAAYRAGRSAAPKIEFEGRKELI